MNAESVSSGRGGMRVDIKGDSNGCPESESAVMLKSRERESVM